MGYSRMICAGNRVMVLFEGYTQEELAPIMKTLNELVMSSGDVPHLIPPEVKPKSGEEAMAEVLKQSGQAPVGRQEKVAEKRRQSLGAGIQPPKFMQNVSTAQKPAVQETSEKAAQTVKGTQKAPVQSKQAAPAATQAPVTGPDTTRSDMPAKPASSAKAPDIKPEAAVATAVKQPAKPVASKTAETPEVSKAQEKLIAQTAKESAVKPIEPRTESVTKPAHVAPNIQTAKAPAPQPQEMPNATPMAQQLQETKTPDLSQMSKAELRNFFATVDRIAFQKILMARGEFKNKGIFLGTASEQQMREYARLVANA